MNVWQHVQRLIRGKTHDATSHAAPPPRMMDDEPEPIVPEITVDELAAALGAQEPPLMIDIREPYEWRLVRMPAARHIPMNDLPAHLNDHPDTLPHDRPIVVICAHGSRSYSVAAWLIEQGFEASSLAGGITQWSQQGMAVEQGPP